MYHFCELVYRSTAFSLVALAELRIKVLKELETKASNSLVRTLQMIQLQKAVIAIGLFSLFESILQDSLACKNGFHGAKKILYQSGNIKLVERFENYISAINVLKHGKGKSYDVLVKKSKYLPFRLKLPGEDFFNEGNVSEVSTLIEVNDEFVEECAKLIEEVSEEIIKLRPNLNY